MGVAFFPRTLVILFSETLSLDEFWSLDEKIGILMPKNENLCASGNFWSSGPYHIFRKVDTLDVASLAATSKNLLISPFSSALETN